MMSKGLLADRSGDIAAGVAALSDALGHLSLARDAAQKRLAPLPPGHKDEMMALKLTLAVGHLTAAAAALPNEMWALMLSRDIPGVGSALRADDMPAQMPEAEFGVECGVFATV